MGSELVKGTPPTSKKVGGANNPTHISILEDAAPYYLSIGMSLDEYWNGDCHNAVYYRKADKLKRQRANEDAWLQGAYVYSAISALVPVLRFSMKSHDPIPYLEKPFDLNSAKSDVPVKSKEQIAYETGFAKMKAWADKVNKKKGGTGDG